MGKHERSIKIAFDIQSGKFLDADVVFDKNEDPFSLRKKYHQKELVLSCCECDQEIGISDSKFNRLHFKHKAGHAFCALADGKQSPQDHVKFTNILKAKESDRHKHLKTKIGQLLQSVDGVDTSSIAIDNKFIIRDNEKRRPDVYCRYRNKELVFEIQLSDLSLCYILSRYNFYKKHGIYLIWILDDFDVRNQGSLERDIKYLTQYENFFKLDENAIDFRLDCRFKLPILTERNELRTPWCNESVSLNQVKFDSEIFQIFFHDFGSARAKKEIEQKEKAAEIKEYQQRKLTEEKLASAKNTSESLIDEICKLRKEKTQSFQSVANKISNLSEYDLRVFNDTLGFIKKSEEKIPVFHKWLNSELTRDDVAFFDFILKCNKIELEVNEFDRDGRSVFQAICENEKISKHFPFKSLFQRGYKMSEGDKTVYSTICEFGIERKKELIIFDLFNRLDDRTLVDAVSAHSKLLFIIESAKLKQVVGYNRSPNDIIWLANNAIQYHREYWEYIELAFVKYEFWDIVNMHDKNKSFEKKLDRYYSEMPEQKYDVDAIFRDLYLEIFF